MRDATAEHLIEAFEALPKKEQIVMVKKLLRDALREDEMNETMVLERAPEVKISKSEGDERAMDGTASSSSSSSSSTMIPPRPMRRHHRRRRRCL